MENGEGYDDLPVLETGRLRLRPIVTGDAEAIFEYASDPLVTQYLPWRPHQSLQDTYAFLATRREWPDILPWGIQHKADGKLIGSCGFHHWSLEHSRAELGYVLARHYWNRGYMTEAVHAVIAYGFEAMLLNRIEALCRVPNLASARVMEKVGMTCEGVLRQYMLAKGTYHDYRIFGLLREEYTHGGAR